MAAPRAWVARSSRPGERVEPEAPATLAGSRRLVVLMLLSPWRGMGGAARSARDRLAVAPSRRWAVHCVGHALLGSRAARVRMDRHPRCGARLRANRTCVDGFEGARHGLARRQRRGAPADGRRSTGDRRRPVEDSWGLRLVPPASWLCRCAPGRLRASEGATVEPDHAGRGRAACRPRQIASPCLPQERSRPGHGLGAGGHLASGPPGRGGLPGDWTVAPHRGLGRERGHVPRSNPGAGGPRRVRPARTVPRRPRGGRVLRPAHPSRAIRASRGGHVGDRDAGDLPRAAEEPAGPDRGRSAPTALA